MLSSPSNQRSPNTNPNTEYTEHNYIFHACSTFALENIKKGKVNTSIFAFFYRFFFFSLGGALSPDTTNVV